MLSGHSSVVVQKCCIHESLHSLLTTQEEAVQWIIGLSLLPNIHDRWQCSPNTTTSVHYALPQVPINLLNSWEKFFNSFNVKHQCQNCQSRSPYLSELTHTLTIISMSLSLIVYIHCYSCYYIFDFDCHIAVYQ